MNRAIVTIHGIATEIITYGRWIEDEVVADEAQDIIIIITGNPGIPAFYEEFAHCVQSKLPTKVPVWIIGHTGHTKPPHNYPNFYPDTKIGRHLYDLNGNLEHKIQFMKKYVPLNARIHIIAHSIGSWFVLNMLKDSNIAHRVIKCYLLFPTIERMAESPNGRFLNNIVLRIADIIIFLSWIFILLPYYLQIFLFRIFQIFYGIPGNLTSAVFQLVHPVPLKRIFLLAKQEMILVKELDDDIISQFNDKLFIYYGSKDNWTPISYYEDLKAKHPNTKAYLCKRGFLHSFVLKNSDEMGKLIGDLISKSLSED